MSPRRAPSVPPQIAGFEYVSLLGSGGFADVFLYSQLRPRRRVAIKVLLQDLLDADALERFDSEADRMAQLSTHPSIVTIYEADVSADGRPYLAMEYCSRPSLAHAYKQEPLGVAEALRLGIQVAGAVETAHRAGILHRDIKPANILVTEYNRPALTDFGISGATDGAHLEAEGMSIPWSPPESFADPPRSGVATDIWALAATVYTLLAGRSPFEVPRGANSGADLIARIERSALAPTGRADVPTSLELSLATAMAKRPAARYASALDLARAWQQVQAELQLSVTPIDVLDDAVLTGEAEPDDEPGTRIRQIVTVDPTGPRFVVGPPVRTADAAEVTLAGATAPASRPGPAGAADETVRRFRPAELGDEPPASPPPADRSAQPRTGRSDGPPADPTARPPADPPADPPGEHRPRRSTRRTAGLVAAGVLAVALVLAAAAALRPEAEPLTRPTAVVTSAPMDPVGTVVPAPTDVAGVAQGTDVVFTWTHPDPVAGDTYLWRSVDALTKGAYVETELATATVPASPSGTTCVEVVTRRDGKTSATPAGACAP